MLSSSSGLESRTITANQSKNYNGIDLVKFLCAILVFIIHIPLFQGPVSDVAQYVNFGLQQYLCRLAVPFYFVASGFLLFKKMPRSDLNVAAIKNYCFKLLRLLGIWFVLLFVGGTGHLWYLSATVVAVILLSLCFHFRVRFRYLCILAGLLYTVGLLGGSYYGLIAPLAEIKVFNYIFQGYKLAFETTRNGVFMGFPFVLMGAAFAYYKFNLKPRTALLGLAVSMLFLFGEVFLLKYHNIPVTYNMYIFLLPAAFFLFAFAYTIQLKDRAIYRHLRNIGMLIYFSHRLIDKFVYLGIKAIETVFDVNAVGCQFLISLFVTLLFAIFVDQLSHKEKFKWIHWFFA